MAKKHMKRCPASLISREMPITTTIDRDGVGPGSCRSRVKGPRLKRETSGTLGDPASSQLLEKATSTKQACLTSGGLRTAPGRWVGMGSGLCSDSDPGQEFEDHHSADLNTHPTDTKEELPLPEMKKWAFPIPTPLVDKTVALGAALLCLPTCERCTCPALINLFLACHFVFC